jgi:hypothetical protein
MERDAKFPKSLQYIQYITRSRGVSFSVMTGLWAEQLRSLCPIPCKRNRFLSSQKKPDRTEPFFMSGHPTLLVKFTPEQSMKAQRGSRCVALLFL